MFVLVFIGLLDGSCVLSKLLTRSILSSCLIAVTDDEGDDGGDILLMSNEGLRG